MSYPLSEMATKRTSGWRWAMAAIVLGMLCSGSASAELTRAQANAIVHDQLAKKPGYVEGDLISRSDVEPAFNELLARGLQPADVEVLYANFMRNNDYLLLLLSTPEGTRFMRQAAGLPYAYDRLERLAWAPAGRELLGELITRKDGLDVLKSLTTPAGADVVKEVMANDRRAQNFQLPTGRIHTEQELRARLPELFPSLQGE